MLTVFCFIFVLFATVSSSGLAMHKSEAHNADSFQVSARQLGSTGGPGHWEGAAARVRGACGAWELQVSIKVADGQ